MIKLNRGECPQELTDEVREELTKLYALNKDKDVWNSPKIKKPLKEALLDMSFQKCAYCECVLGIESKDVTIDHFLPKSVNADKVVEWQNLFPSCLRCNRQKNDNITTLVNPCKDEPRLFLALYSKNPIRLKGIDSSGIGKNTIEAIGLNDIDRVMVPRLREWEAIFQRLEDICEDIQEEGYKLKYKRRFYTLLQECTASNAYSAVKATNMLNSEPYSEIKEIIISYGEWTDKFQQTEDEMKRIALQLI